MDNKAPGKSTDQSAPQPQKLGGGLRLIALGLVLLLIVGTPISLFAFNLYQAVFDRPLIKNLLADEAVNHDLLPVWLEWFSERRAQERVETGEALVNIDEPDIALLLSFMDKQDWKDVRTEVFTPEIITEWVGVTVDGAYDWLDSDDLVPQIAWDMTTFKNRVNTDHGEKAIAIAFDNLPPCAQSEIDDFLTRAAAAGGTEVLYNLCKFPDPWREDQLSDYLNALRKVAANIPAKFELTDELAANLPDTPGVGPTYIKQELRLIRFLGAWVWALPLIVLALLLLFGRVTSLQRLAGWWGLPLGVTALATLVPYFTYRSLLTGVLTQGPLSEVPDVVREESVRAILRLAGHVFDPLLWQAILVAGLGLLIVILGWYAGRKKKPASTPALAINKK